METTTMEKERSVKTSNTKDLERSLIKSMAGCFTVTFRFAETFAPNKNYKYDERYHESAKEFTFILEESENKISLQHILLVDQEKNIMIKHWRQDWLYENTELLSYVKNDEWRKIHLTQEEAKGTWTQKVYQVDDTPRYEGFGKWVHFNGHHYWDMITDAPLPRRELTKRHDYNVINRKCRIEIFSDGGWRLEQDNLKILRDDQLNDTLVCMEKGLETFTVNPYEAKPFEDWWKARANFWADVRAAWENHIAKNDTVKVHYKIGDTLLYAPLYQLAEQFSGDNYDAVASQTAINQVLSKHVVNY